MKIVQYFVNSISETVSGGIRIFLDGTLCRYNMETKNCLLVTCSDTAHPLSSTSFVLRELFPSYTRAGRTSDRHASYDSTESEVYRLYTKIAD